MAKAINATNLGAKLMPFEGFQIPILPYSYHEGPITIAAECSATFDAFYQGVWDNEMDKIGDWPNRFHYRIAYSFTEYLNANGHRCSLIEKWTHSAIEHDVVIFLASPSSWPFTNLGRPVVCISLDSPKACPRAWPDLYRERPSSRLPKPSGVAALFHRKHRHCFPVSTWTGIIPPINLWTRSRWTWWNSKALVEICMAFSPENS